jgi:sirohydrochlorin cobaltochelatase
MSTPGSTALEAPAFETGTATASGSGWRGAALVLCAHGSRGGVGSAADHAAAIRELGCFGVVHACALKGRPSLAETIGSLAGRERIILVPMLMAEGYTSKIMLRRLDELVDGSGRLRVCPPVGSHPRLSSVLAKSAEQSCALRGWSVADTGLLIVGHGTRRDPRSGVTARRHAEHIAQTGRFAEVTVAFLDEEPGVEQVLARAARPRWVVVGLFADHGEHGELDVPRMLEASGRETAYTGPIGADERIVGLILEQVHGLDEGAPDVRLEDRARHVS